MSPSPQYPDGHAEYDATVLRLLGEFQSLELALKLYLSACFSVIRNLVDHLHPIRFSYDYKAIENFPLERLLEMFKRYNSHTILHKKLDKLKLARNHIAHKALVEKHESIRQLLNINVTFTEDKLQEVSVQISDALSELTHQLNAVVAQSQKGPGGSSLRPHPTAQPPALP